MSSLVHVSLKGNHLSSFMFQAMPSSGGLLGIDGDSIYFWFQENVSSKSVDSVHIEIQIKAFLQEMLKGVLL